MKTSIVQLHEIDKYKKYLGNKTLNLKKSVDFGFKVPKFIALPSLISKSLLSDKNTRKEIADEIINILHCKKYAIRSSALIEDTKGKSLAGQFLTKTDISRKDLEKNIYTVIKQADTYLNGDLDKFSTIIQEYISPDIAGVTFTRNPNGNREMIVEYGFCEGEKIVSGEMKPNKISFYWNNELAKNLPNSFSTNQTIKKFKDLEKKNNFPQDIEWCIKDNQFYLLQNRPITTISDKQYQQIIFLEEVLPKQGKYYFAKTEVSEIAPKPTLITLDILKQIYSNNGPVDKVYKKYGVNYQDTDFLKIIGNELYVDKEKEIHGLLASYSYLDGKDYSAKFKKYSKTLSSLKNLFFLNKIKTSGHEKLFDELKTKIEAKKPKTDLKTAFKTFLTDYETIFETNLLSGLSIKKLNLILKNEPINFAEIISNYSLFIDLEEYNIQYTQALKGNSLEISDESSFITDQDNNKKENAKLKNWWANIPKYKQKILQEKITEAIIYNRLREIGRWLTIKNINIIRNLLLDHAKNYGWQDTKNIYFANLDNVLNNKANEKDCLTNKTAYNKYNDFNLPNRLTAFILEKKTELLGVSAGLANGILQTQETIEKKATKNKQIILYTEILSPDLTVYFDKISGIISNNGSLLSHLAIIAREKNIPVVVGFSLNDNKLQIGDNIQIDGSEGKINRII